MKVLLAISIFIFLNSCRIITTKNHKKIDKCQLLEVLLENKKFCKGSSFNVCGSDTVKIIDEKRIFKECYNKAIKGIVFKSVKRNYLPHEILPFSEDYYYYYNVIKIDSLITRKDTIILFISRKLTNLDGEFQYIKDKNGYKIVKDRIGQS